MTEDNDLVVGKSLSEILGQFQAIPDVLVQGEAGRVSAVPPIRLASTPLIPLNDDESALVGSERRDQGRLHIAGSTMQDEQDRVVRTVAADRDPLVDPLQLDKACFFDPRA